MDNYFDNLQVSPEGVPLKAPGGRGAGKKVASGGGGPILQTRSESNIDKKKRVADAIRKKGNGSRFSLPGRNLFKSKKDRQHSKGAVAPTDYSERPGWVDPNHKDYRDRGGFSCPSGAGAY